MIVAVTELRLKNHVSYFRFIFHAVRSFNQARKAPGNISSKTGSQGMLIQRTLTHWKDKESLLKYVRSGAHLEAMKITSKVGRETLSYHFESQREVTWAEALDALRENADVIPIQGN